MRLPVRRIDALYTALATRAMNNADMTRPATAAAICHGATAPSAIRAGMHRGTVGGKKARTLTMEEGLPELNEVADAKYPTKIGMLMGKPAACASLCRDTSEPAAA